VIERPLGKTEISFLNDVAIATDLLCADEADRPEADLVIGGLLRGQSSSTVTNALLETATQLMTTAQVRCGELSLTDTVERVLSQAVVAPWGIEYADHYDDVRLLALTLVESEIDEPLRRAYVTRSRPVDILIHLTELVIATSAVLSELDGHEEPGDALREVLDLPDFVTPTF